MSEEQGGPGVLARRINLRAYIPGEGLHVEVKYGDLFLDAPDNNFSLWFKISEAALIALAGRPIIDDADAKSVAQKNNTIVINVVKKVISRDGLSSPGGRPREITAEDVR